MKKPAIDIEKEVEKIGKRMRELRKARGYTSAEKFAFINDLDRAQYGRYEAGKKDFRISSFIRILNALEVSWNEFFGEEYES